jgi:transmembrane sensor
MNNTDRTIELDPLMREAVDWIHRLAAGTATVADGEAFKRWRRQSPAHAAAYAEASCLWQEFGPAARNLRLRGEIPPGLARVPPRSEVPTRRLILGGGLAAAAAACGCAVIKPPLDLWPSFAELAADYRTATGEQRKIALPGDVSVRLNTQTSIALRAADGSADRVELIAGEASFSTAESKRPLTVLAADGRAVASNAWFDVRRAGTAVCVTCTDGHVEVEYRTDATTIGPGQQARYDENGLGHVATIDSELVTAWQEGVLIFRLTPLSEVVEEVNRYRRGKVILLNAALGRKPVSGRFRIDHMDEILVRLDQAFGAKSRSLPGGIVLLS